MKNILFICSLLLVAVSCVPAKQKQGDRSEEAGGYATFDIMPSGEYFNQCLPFSQSDRKDLKATHKKIVFSDKKPHFSLITYYYSTSCQERTPKVAVSQRVEGDINYSGYLDIGDKNVWTRRIEVSVTKMFYIAKQQAGLNFIRDLFDAPTSVAIDQEYLIASEQRAAKYYGVLSAMRGQRNKMHVYLDNKKVTDQQVKNNLIPSNVYVQTVRK